jgi:hypothetical protein
MDASNEEPIDLSDPELEKAATKIQATFKGFKARQEIRGAGTTSPPAEDKQTPPEEVSRLNEETMKQSAESPSFPSFTVT